MPMAPWSTSETWAVPNSEPKITAPTSCTTAATRLELVSLQLSNANALEVDRLALIELERLSKRFPPGMYYENAFDTTEAVGESIYDVLSTLLEAIVLVILVIYIFLEDWRTTVIPAITIPVSLIGTFAFVKLLGFSINTLTLFWNHVGHRPGGR